LNDSAETAEKKPEEKQKTIIEEYLLKMTDGKSFQDIKHGHVVFDSECDSVDMCPSGHSSPVKAH